jgi:hypothetical protein
MRIVGLLTAAGLVALTAGCGPSTNSGYYGRRRATTRRQITTGRVAGNAHHLTTHNRETPWKTANNPLMPAVRGGRSG